MIGSENGELVRLLKEPSTFTGRTPASLLILNDREGNGTAERTRTLLGCWVTILRIDSGDHLHMIKFRRMMEANFAAGLPVIVELSADPHPEFYAILERAIRDGQYPVSDTPGAAPDYRQMPPGCPIAVIADRELIEQKISHPQFFKLFEVIENFSCPEVICQN